MDACGEREMRATRNWEKIVVAVSSGTLRDVAIHYLLAGVPRPERRSTMTVVDALTITGALALVAVVIKGFRRSSRIPPSGRDPASFEGPPAA
jgi:hypothetical protein